MKSRKVITMAICFVVLIFSGCSSFGNNKNPPVVTITKKITASTAEEEQTTTEAVSSEDDLADVQTTIAPTTEEPTTTEKEVAIVTENSTNESVTTTEAETTTTQNIEIAEQEYSSNSVLPDSIMSVVNYWQEVYPKMEIGVGIYSLDGKSWYEYNANTPINSACTIKAAYALYVLTECERQGINIWSEENFITFEKRHDDPEGSGIIKNTAYGTQYSIGYLVNLLLGVSDNVAFQMLEDRFPIASFYQYNISIGGESDWLKWGRATVQQRKNEWLAIYNYINSGSRYSEILRNDLTGTGFCYIVEGMSNWHNYLHKSGWTDENPSYPASGDCAIIDDEYLIIVLTQDYSAESGHIDAIRGIAGAVETFYYENGGIIF